MKLKFKLSLLVIVILAGVVAGISIILLREASDISTGLSLRGVRYLAGWRAEYWKGREDGYLKELRTIAKIMSDYESLPVESRRDRFDGMLQGALASDPDMMSVYSIWKPGALDELDAHYTNRTGSGPTGQYAMAYSRETGKIQGRTSADIEAAMA